MGDVFACHVVGNPDETSETYLLAEYAPTLSDTVIRRLSRAFSELRQVRACDCVTVRLCAFRRKGVPLCV